MDTGLRARKKRETRRRLIASAIELGERHGIDNVTVADIAESANVSRRTFFNYFSSREEALVGFDLDRSRELAVLLETRPSGEPVWSSIRHALTDFYAHDSTSTDRSWVARIRLARSHPSLAGELRTQFGQLEDVLAAAVAHRLGDDTDALRPRLVAAVAMTTIRVAIDDWLSRNDATPMPRAVDDALRQVEHNLLGGHLSAQLVPATPG